jgi:hypothetical protein
MAKMKDKTLLQKLQEVMPPYLASYLCWYYADPKTRCSWEELCSYDANFKCQGENAGQYKTEEFAEQNWLIREDVQKGMVIYMQHMKRYNFMKRYQEMTKKALSGDVNAAKYIDDMDKQLDKMSIDKEQASEIDELLKGVNINGN